MITRTKIGLLVGLMVVSLASSAMADKLCLQTTVNRRTLRATNKSVVAATCPRGYTQLADTSSFRGATGPAGAAGTVNLGACRLTGQECNHGSGFNTCSASCNQGEFVLQHSFATSTGAGGVCSLNYSYHSMAPFYSNGLGAGMVYFSGANCSYQARVDILCCPVS